MPSTLERNKTATGGYMPVEFYTPEDWLIVQIGDEIIYTHDHGDSYHRDQALGYFKAMLDMLGLEYEEY